MRIDFFNKSGDFVFKGKMKHRQWVVDTAQREGQRTGEISIIFCTDEELLEINREHLDHDYYTDIITFDYSTVGTISGDLFISLDRVRENGQEYGGGFTGELSRVIIHGVLHLLGYKDKSDEEAKTMREKEDFYLDILKQL